MEEQNTNQMTIKKGFSFWDDSKGVPSGKKVIVTATGRRKTATARIFLYLDKGEILVNNMPIDSYFTDAIEKHEWLKPFHTVGISHPEAQFSATIKVSGSGKSAQVGAVKHGFARVLAKLSEENAVALRSQDLLTRDSRMVERKKPFLRKARKRPQFSKR